jgi:hypothetical protein
VRFPPPLRSAMGRIEGYRCVLATDKAENASKKRCAGLLLRKA